MIEKRKEILYSIPSTNDDSLDDEIVNYFSEVLNSIESEFLQIRDCLGSLTIDSLDNVKSAYEIADKAADQLY